jgi:hypothetical protein
MSITTGKLTFIGFIDIFFCGLMEMIVMLFLSFLSVHFMKADRASGMVGW